VEILRWLHEAVWRKRSELWPNGLILHHDNAPAIKTLSVKQFLDQKSITEMEHHSCSSNLAPNYSWFFKKKNALKGQRFLDTQDNNNNKKK
jgi:hypothetical protein